VPGVAGQPPRWPGRWSGGGWRGTQRADDVDTRGVAAVLSLEFVEQQAPGDREHNLPEPTRPRAGSARSIAGPGQDGADDKVLRRLRR
jgi:hypothetical protein